MSASLANQIFKGDISEALPKDEEPTEETKTILHVEQSAWLEMARSLRNVPRVTVDDEKEFGESAPIEHLYKHFVTSSAVGLETTEAQRRIDEKYGLNQLQSDPKLPLWKAFLLQFANVVILMLVAASIISLSLGEWVEGAAILFVVTLNASISVYTERSANNALESLMSLTQPNVSVIRDGETKEVKGISLVPGDIVLLKTGDIVPADIRLVDTRDLLANEMILTGEPIDVKKEAIAFMSETERSTTLTPTNMVFSGTSITSGRAKGLVVTTGINTRVGHIAKLIKDPNQTRNMPASTTENQQTKRSKFRFGPKKTPLQKSIHRLALLMGLFAIIISTIIFITGLVRNHFDPAYPHAPVWLQMLLISVSLCVSAVPEGLPLAITVCLALGAMRLSRVNVLVRQLAAVESLGAADVICTDKTGTLTEGKMTTVRVYSGFRELVVTGKGHSLHGKFLYNDEDVFQIEGTDKSLVTTLLVGTLCNDAKLTYDEDSKLWKPIGNATESPILIASAKANIWKDSVDMIYPRIDEVPFTSSRKLMITIHSTSSYSNTPININTSASHTLQPSTPDSTTTSHSSRKTVTSQQLSPPQANVYSFPPMNSDTAYITCIKGAPDYLLSKCPSVLLPNGSIVDMDKALKTRIESAVNIMSSQALRVIALAYKPITKLPYKVDDMGSSKTSQTTTNPISISKDPSSNEYPSIRSVFIDTFPAASFSSATSSSSNMSPAGASGDATTAAVLSSDEKCELVVNGLVFCGLVGSLDPEREGVKEAVDVAREAGIRVVMITGDYVKTAVAIARNIGLLQLGADIEVEAIDCQSLRPHGDEYLPDIDMDELTQNAVVFARAKPEDKLMIVRSLQRQQHLCAMTGDGVNDAPALRASDIGVAMGSGTSVAKQSSKLILMDDNFVNIIKAVEHGRVIYSNMQKFIIYLIGTNSVQIFIIFFCVLFGLPTPLDALQILFVNLATDGMPALALSAEKGEEDLMKFPPRRKSKPIIDGARFALIMGHAFFLLIALVVAFCVGLYWHLGSMKLSTIYPPGTNPDTVTCSRMDSDGQWHQDSGRACVVYGISAARTMVFLTLIFSEILRSLSVRSLYKPIIYRLFTNWYLIGAIILSTILTLLATLVPPIQVIFGTVYIGYHAWLLCIALSLVTLIGDEYVKRLLSNRITQDKHWNHMESEFDEIKMEIRALRSHMNRLEQILTPIERIPPPRRLKQIMDNDDSISNGSIAMSGSTTASTLHSRWPSTVNILYGSGTPLTSDGLYSPSTTHDKSVESAVELSRLVPRTSSSSSSNDNV